MPSRHLRQVDSPSGQANFHSHLLNVHSHLPNFCQLNHSKSKLRPAQGKPNLRVSCPKGKLEKTSFFLDSCPGYDSECYQEPSWCKEWISLIADQANIHWQNVMKNTTCCTNLKCAKQTLLQQRRYSDTVSSGRWPVKNQHLYYF